MRNIAFRSMAAFAFACLFVLCVAPIPAFAHALVGTRINGGSAVALEFAYSTGDVPAYAAIEVYGPDDAKVEFQNGRTDRLGRFAFVPDKPGLWRAVLSDNMGHRAEVPVNVGTPGAAASQSGAVRPERPASVALKALLGVSALLNLGVFLTWLKRRGKSGAAGAGN